MILQTFPFASTERGDRHRGAGEREAKQQSATAADGPAARYSVLIISVEHPGHLPYPIHALCTLFAPCPLRARASLLD